MDSPSLHLEFKCLKIPCLMSAWTLERKGHFLLPFSFILKKPPRSDKGPSGKLSYNDPLINIGPVPRSYFTLMQTQTRKKPFVLSNHNYLSSSYFQRDESQWDAHFALILQAEQEVIYQEEMHNRHPLHSCILPCVEILQNSNLTVIDTF